MNVVRDEVREGTAGTARHSVPAPKAQAGLVRVGAGSFWMPIGSD